MHAKIDWSKVVFADEKLWFLDGPAVRPKVWQDKRFPPVRIPTKGNRNEAVAVWGAFSLGKVPDLCVIPNHCNSAQYCDTLANALLPHVSVQQYTLYHDRLPAHMSAQTERWLQAHHLKTVLFPAKGADMNPIENLWGIVTRKVYGGTKTYTNTDSLIAAVNAAWAEIQQNKGLRRKLVSSMSKRLAEVVGRRGDWISY